MNALTVNTASTCRRSPWGLLLAACCALSLGGCTTLLSPISGVPSHRVPCQFLGEPRANQVPIDLARLRQDPPAEYLLGPKDILGIYIEGVIGKSDEPPPVHFPQDSNLPPALGYPIPVREDDTLALPLVPPLRVTGLTLTETQNLIRKTYTEDFKFLKAGRDRIIVTLIRARTYQVIVIRQDSASGAGNLGGQGGGQGANQFVRGSSLASSSRVVNLPAYENDVMHALAATGGLPGLDAKNEVKILRGKFANGNERDRYLQEQIRKCIPADPCICPPPLPLDPTIIVIPLRLPPGVLPNITQDDIILQDGDIVSIEARETEVFYTGGLLGGREIPLPRDYDLDILGAIALAGGPIGTGQGVGITGLGGASPTNALVLRPLACGGQITIAVDLNRALNDPAARILIQPRDTLILRYKPVEELTNFGLGTFFTYGISQLFNRN